MLSVIFCSRVKDNPDSNVKRLLDSAATFTCCRRNATRSSSSLSTTTTTTSRPPDSFFAAYPFAIRTFVWGRAEEPPLSAPRPGIPVHPAHATPRSRFLLMTADDFRFIRTGFVSEILSIKDEFCIIGLQPSSDRSLGRRLRDRKGDPSMGGLL